MRKIKTCVFVSDRLNKWKTTDFKRIQKTQREQSTKKWCLKPNKSILFGCFDFKSQQENFVLHVKMPTKFISILFLLVKYSNVFVLEIASFLGNCSNIPHLPICIDAEERKNHHKNNKEISLHFPQKMCSLRGNWIKHNESKESLVFVHLFYHFHATFW